MSASRARRDPVPVRARRHLPSAHAQRYVPPEFRSRSGLTANRHKVNLYRI